MEYIFEDEDDRIFYCKTYKDGLNHLYDWLEKDYVWLGNEYKPTFSKEERKDENRAIRICGRGTDFNFYEMPRGSKYFVNLNYDRVFFNTEEELLSKIYENFKNNFEIKKGCDYTLRTIDEFCCKAQSYTFKIYEINPIDGCELNILFGRYEKED